MMASIRTRYMFGIYSSCDLTLLLYCKIHVCLANLSEFSLFLFMLVNVQGQ
jgi:hypothetical protein